MNSQSQGIQPANHGQQTSIYNTALFGAVYAHVQIIANAK